ncbi:MAG: alpha/beta hydrolase [Candidatus Sericytochromatia bacterium]
MIKEKIIEIICLDNNNSKLVATIYFPVSDIKGAIMIGPATGIKRKFYANFAKYLAENNYGVITYDNNGIGDSVNGDLKLNKSSLQSWGEKDMPNVFNILKENFPNTKYHLIGHSAGGQLVGLIPSCNEFTSMFNFACSSGSIRNMRIPFKLKAKIFMDIFIPINNFLFGYTNAQWVGMGEPLPKMVAQEWSNWCNGTGYVKTAFNKTINTHWYDEINFPSMWLNAIDDDIANNKNVSDMISVFPKIKSETLTLNPKEYNLKEIGHMKFFTKENKILWKIALDWLDKL